MIYFDNAATPWPKPPGVAEAMTHFLEAVGANPGISTKMIPVPRQISSDCGACVRIHYGDMDAVRRAVEAVGIEVESIQAI
jgi:hypothetical protein